MARFAPTVRRQGEWCIREDGVQELKASITNSTKATYSLAARASFYEGLIEKGPTVGEYLFRENDGMEYIVNSTQIQPRDTTLEYVFLARANDVVALARPVYVSAGSDQVSAWDVYSEGVKVYKTITTRSMKEQMDGLIDQAIYIMHIPARFGVMRLDRVYLAKDGEPLSDCKYYRVESIDDSLSPLYENVDTSGVDVIQLTEDKRTGKATTEPDNPNGGLWG